MNLVVMKFGGTSVDGAEAMRRVGEIVRRSPARKTIVVLSACAGVTNQLLRIGHLAADGGPEEAAAIIQELTRRHLMIARDLLSPSVRPEVEAAIEAAGAELLGFVRGISVLGELTPRSLDLLASYGERLSSLVFAASLNGSAPGSTLVDARTFMVTDDQYTKATPDLEETSARLQRIVGPLLEAGRFDERERGQSSGYRDRIAGKRARLVHGTERGDALHDVAPSTECAHRHAAANHLAECSEVGRDAKTLLRAPGCHAKTRHHFVEHKQRAVARAFLPQRLQESRRGQDEVHVARDRFHDHARDFGPARGE